MQAHFTGSMPPLHAVFPPRDSCSNTHAGRFHPALSVVGARRPVVNRYGLLEEEGQLKGKTEKQIDDLRRGAIKLKQLRIKRPANSYVIEVSYRAHNPTLAADGLTSEVISVLVREH